ncbi:GNAT family N-acetyltransferase [Halorarum salinum]|uniref:GNAT family N-acetyltransferase n=1 Tax=Halorarum salinum TaxID=2743089 RepID=A0A7D5LCM7_9EURY|nr:GNAT family N-acetyltransferase [Halobaculum salinum]QLG63414.1 GNAT family N-acetyltransferase [Halobaculum salinum]
MTVREVETAAERAAAFPVLAELRSHLDEEQFERLYAEMADEGYRLFAAYDDGEPIAVAGVTLSTNFYLGGHAYVYDLVTTADRRSEGHGKRLLEHVHEWARDRGCEAVELESGLWREDAHRFYEEMGYEKYCYSFKHDLQ